MADAFASIVKDQVQSIINQEFKLIVGVDDELGKISTTLDAIQAELKDAEERQVKEGAVKVWLEELKDVTYSIDDVLDEWSTRTLMLQSEVVDNSALVRKVCTSLHCFCLDEDVLNQVVFFPSRFGFDQLILRHNIAHRIKNIRMRLDSIAFEKNKYNFNPRERTEEPERIITSSIVNTPMVRGREQDEEIIISKLLSESSLQNESHPIISIVGMGGLGKTTLAQKIFNDDRVKTHFGEKRWWVCVSDPFDEMRVAKAIIEATGEKVPDVHTWNALHQCLHKSIEGKLFLLVLDDVWTDKYQKWERFRVSLNHGAPGSRIVVTTRKRNVAVMMGSTYNDIHDLATLSEDDMWSLLVGIALFERREEERIEFEEIGRKIASKCKGLPLAAKALGSLLRFRKTKQDWLNVLESETWRTEGVEVDVMPALLLSYYDLPSHLKCCFEYCGIFPKDSRIVREELIGLWMAQGFLSSNGEKEMERICGEYFDDLVTRSLLHPTSVDKNGIALECNMHDMVHDLVQFITKKECLIIDQDAGNQVAEFGCSANKIRHLTLLWDNIDNNIVDVPSICQAVNLRTLKCFSKGYRYHIPPLLPVSLCNLTCLRSLDLSGLKIQELPIKIEKLIHLRYLNLSRTNLVELPECMSKLHNLQTLNLQSCQNLVKLPPGIVNLRKMRCLDIYFTQNLASMPKGIGRLTSLRTLTRFMVSDNPDDGCKICELQNLNHLRGRLEITGLEKVTCRDEAREAKLSKKHQLHSLQFDWSAIVADEEKERCEGVLDGLQPPSNLESLGIRNYPGAKFPKNWMSGDGGMALCPNLRRLYIKNCKKCLRLSLPKLPSLEVLDIDGLEDVRYIGRNFVGIKDDDVEEMHGTDDDEENDDDINIMPNLQDLRLIRCSKLKVLPRHLSHTQLRKLFVSSCPSLSWASSCLFLPLLEELELWRDVGDLSKTLAPKYVFLPSLKFLSSRCSFKTLLPEGLCHLTTLRVLSIDFCDHVNNLYEELQRLNMLQELSLSFFLFEQGNKAVEYLSKMSHIPHITINHKRIK